MNTLRTSLLLFLSTFICTGCINIIEELWWNEDTGGVFHYTIETTPEVGALLLGQQKNSETFSGLFREAIDNDIDTVLSQKLFFEGFGEEGFAYPNLLEHNQVRVFSNDSYLSFTFITHFSHVDELNMGMTNLRGLSTMMRKSPFPDEETSKLSRFFSFENGRLNRIQVEDHSNGALMSQQDRMAAELFFSEAIHKLIFHVPEAPSEIKFDNYETQGNKIVVTKSLIDILSGKEIVSGSIKY